MLKKFLKMVALPAAIALAAFLPTTANAAPAIVKTLLFELPQAKVFRVQVTFDNSYPVAGESIAVGEGDIIFIATEDVGLGYLSRPVVAAAPETGTFTALLFEADYSASTDGPLIVVPDAEDLNTLVVKYIVVVRNL